MTNNDFKKLIEVKLERLEVSLGFTVESQFKNVFASALMTDGAYEEYKKLNEVDHLGKYRGIETVGDAVLGLIVSDLLADKHYNREQITEVKKTMVSNQALQKRCHFMKDMMIEVNVANTDKKKYAKAIERLLGALHRTYGDDIVKKYMREKNVIEN